MRYLTLLLIFSSLLLTSCKSNNNLEEQIEIPRKINKNNTVVIKFEEVENYILNNKIDLIIIGDLFEIKFNTNFSYSNIDTLRDNYKLIDKAGSYIILTQQSTISKEIADEMSVLGFENIYWVDKNFNNL